MYYGAARKRLPLAVVLARIARIAATPAATS